ncbi:MAG TPA: glycosyl hydrolase family 28-related protein [Rudaea sp.]|nr:glycosyl hydrolase family 28-related protein [Rudaea sp.]
MTVTTTTASQTFQGNDTATAFPCQFEIFQNTDINVFFVNPATGTQTQAVLNTDYTVAGAGASAGFTVNTTVAVPTGTNLYVVRALPLTQLIDFTNQGAFFPTLHETAFDRLCMLIQQIANFSEGLNITMPPGLVPQPSAKFPIPLAGSLIGWNAAGDELVNTGPTTGAGGISDINVAANAGVQSTKLAFTQAGTGAVARTVQAKLQDVVSVADFGAVGDGVADCTAAFQAALNAVSTAGGGCVTVPNGSYVVGALTLASNVRLAGAGLASTTLIPDAASITVLSGSSCNNVVVENLSIGCAAKTGVTGISFTKGWQCTIRNVQFEGCATSFVIDRGSFYDVSGIFLTGSSSIGAGGCKIWSSSDTDYVHDVVLRSVAITNAGNGVTGTGIYIRRGVSVLVSNAHANDMVTGGTAQNFIVVENDSQGCKIVECGSPYSNIGLLVQTGSGVAVAPTFLDVISFDSDQCVSHAIDIEDGEWIRIIGGNLTASGRTPAAFALLINGATSVFVDGVTVQGFSSTPGSGIYIANGTDIQLRNCVIDTCYYGFTFAATNAGITMIGCALQNCSNAFNGALPSDAGSFFYGNKGLSSYANTVPGMPASGTALVNPFPFACRIWVWAGTVSAFHVAETGIPVGTPFYTDLEPGESIKITYTSAPSWTWQAK